MASIEKVGRTNDQGQEGYRVRWRITLPDGSRPQRQKTEYGYKAAKDLAARMEQEHEARHAGPTEEATVGQAIEDFLKVYYHEVREASWDRAKTELKLWVGPQLGWDTMVHDLTFERDVLPLVTDRPLFDQNNDPDTPNKVLLGDDGEPVLAAPGTRQRTKSVAEAFFKFAAKYAGGRNLSKRLSIKHCGYSDEREAGELQAAMVPSWDTYEQLCQAMDDEWQPRGNTDNPWRASDCLALIAMGAFRWSEAAGIRPEDDKGDHLELRKTRDRDGNVRDYGKNSAWRRDVPVTKFLRPSLDRLHEVVDGGFLLCSWTGSPMHHSLFGRHYRKAREEVGVEWTIHDLRHLGASLWIRSGASPFLVMRAGGWTSLDQVEQTYGHLWPKDVGRLAEQVNQLDVEELRDAHTNVGDREIG